METIETKPNEPISTPKEKEEMQPNETQKTKVDRKKKISGSKQSSKISLDLVPSNESKDDDGKSFNLFICYINFDALF